MTNQMNIEFFQYHAKGEWPVAVARVVTYAVDGLCEVGRETAEAEFVRTRRAV